jgi:hypothetical protein
MICTRYKEPVAAGFVTSLKPKAAAARYLYETI